MSDLKKGVLLVEDDMVDAMTIRRAFADLGINYPLKQVQDGQAALEYLEDPHQALPAFILLDLNMPRMNGIEFLEARHRSETLRRIPVIVLTTSNEERDRVDSFDLCVSGYMVKPVEYDRFLEVIRTIDSYWAWSATPT